MEKIPLYSRKTKAKNSLKIKFREAEHIAGCVRFADILQPASAKRTTAWEKIPPRKTRKFGKLAQRPFLFLIIRQQLTRKNRVVNPLATAWILAENGFCGLKICV